MYTRVLHLSQGYSNQSMTMMIMITVDLYSALCRAPLLCYVSQCIVKMSLQCWKIPDASNQSINRSI